MARSPAAAPPSALRTVVHLLHRAAQRADDVFSNHAAVPITARQYAMLSVVAEREGLGQIDIMAATGIDRSSVADLARRMVARGWLQRRRTKEDARLYAVRLTPEGRRVLAMAAPAAHAADESLLATLSPDQRAAFRKALATLVLRSGEA
jgi:DNA-binding MarR family transcriptional regulator